jgi:hypothetical protein
VIWALLAACGPSDVQIGDVTRVVPSDGLPAEIAVQNANNNLDVTRHDGRVFLAWRTAPTHFASADTELFVASSEDEVTWRLEGRFHLGTDLREPQLVSFGGELALYFAVLGDDPAAFEPQGARRAVYRGPGDWTEPEPVFDADFIPWRIQVEGDRLEVTGYTGGQNLYEPDGEPIRVQWLASDDGVAWGPAAGDDPVVLEGGGSETSLVHLEDGVVVAVVRNEGGDATGFGSKVCRGEASDPGAWRCEPDPRKYDSPLLLRDGDRLWLIARRNVTETGAFDLGNDALSQEDQYYAYQLAYWLEPKRCAVWEVDPVALSVTFAADLPSRGDTCFPEALPDGRHRYVVYNYSSPLDGPDVSWNEGQTGPTYVHRMIVEFPP